MTQKFKETEIGMIPEDWEIKNVDEITDNVCVGFVGTCLQYYCDQSEGVPMIRTTNLTDSGICYSDLKYVSKEFHNKNKKSQLKKGDLVVARHGDNGKICIFEKEFEANCLNIVKIRPDNRKCCNEYLHYAFKNNLVLHQISSSIVGSVQGVLNTKTITKLKIPLPSIKEQTKIISVLKSLDDKIDLNRQMNSTLEQIAQTLFKHWFIDFEFPDENGNPYRSSGGKLVNSELGEIPEGWCTRNLGEFASISSGKRPRQKSESKTKEFNIPLIGASSIMGYVNDILYDEPVLVIGRVGTHGVIQRIFQPSYPSDNTLIIKSRYHEYTYQILKLIDYDSLNIGSTQPLITQTSVKNIKMIIPDNSLLHRFEKMSTSIFSKINSNGIENEKLSNIRDSLLPKLMSGKIRVGC